MSIMTKTDEKAYLETVKEKLSDAYTALDARVRRYANEIKDQKTYLWEHRGDMDHVEKVATRQAAQQMVQSGEVAADSKNRIAKLIHSPYFGRIDFRKDSENEDSLRVYVGIHTFVDDVEKKNLIFDWRAPISTMFYDYELGQARYESPQGTVSGELLLKRQFRIRNGKMEFMLESGLNIMDDVLQEELSRASDERMKNIVATIQRDQNAIIRNEDAEVLIIQGAAGSGKTSIALHRIAFLLYRFKETLSSKDILIISPNKVFGDFISNVLPELGEEQIAEMEMDGLAHELLERKIKFQTFFEQTDVLLEKDDAAMRRRIETKSSIRFLKKLDEYTQHVEESRFTPTDVYVSGYMVHAWIIENSFNKRRSLPIAERLKWAAKAVEHEVWVQYRYEITAQERAELKRAIKKMYKNSTLRVLYKELFTWLGTPELFKMAPKAKLEYADVFPMIYLKMRLEGIGALYPDVKHLLIDEMQDYTPVQYAVISRLFPCGKTILGDVFQSVDPHSSSSSEAINGVFKQAECVKLFKSYRSSYEITQFASAISSNVDVVAIKRHGKTPSVLACKSKKGEIEHVRKAIEAFGASTHHTMGIICKTQKQAMQLHTKISTDNPQIHLLTTQSTAFQQGITICTAHLSKGLEFDEVLVPNACDSNYTTPMDRNLLYIACTRAMHTLTLSHVGTATPFLAAATST